MGNIISCGGWLGYYSPLLLDWPLVICEQHSHAQLHSWNPLPSPAASGWMRPGSLTHPGCWNIPVSPPSVPQQDYSQVAPSPAALAEITDPVVSPPSTRKLCTAPVQVLLVLALLTTWQRRPYRRECIGHAGLQLTHESLQHALQTLAVLRLVTRLYLRRPFSSCLKPVPPVQT